jgi:sugar lactone lactonase YvrE
MDSAGNLLVTDSGNHAIRKITSAGLVSTLAGNGTAGSTNGSANVATFNTPYGIAVDKADNIFVVDHVTNLIRKLTVAGVVSTFAGGNLGLINGAGTAAGFWSPSGLAIDASDKLYVADSSNNAIRMVTPAGVVSTLAGNGDPGYTNTSTGAARFYNPYGVAVDGHGNVYVAEYENSAIRIILP